MQAAVGAANAKATAGTKVEKLSGSSNLPFPRKLHAMLESESSKNSKFQSDDIALEWSESGHAFRIVNDKMFQEKVLPKYFRTARLTSFIRNLNIYGFKKGTVSFEAEPTDEVKHTGWYMHPEFQRSGIEAISKMSRTIGRLPLTNGDHDSRKKTKGRLRRNNSGVRQDENEPNGETQASQECGFEQDSLEERATGRPTPIRSRSTSLPNSMSLSPEFSSFSSKFQNGSSGIILSHPIPTLLETGQKSGLQILSAVADSQDSEAFCEREHLAYDKTSSHVAAKGIVKSLKAKKDMRVGRWNPEEEEYSNRLIREFKAGILPLKEGTMLRIFLSALLNCDPMRISKKFRLEGTIGKQPFSRHWNTINKLQESEKDKKRNELISLEYRFFSACKLATKHSDERGAMPSAMPWLDWMTENEKEVMIKGGRLEIIPDGTCLGSRDNGHSAKATGLAVVNLTPTAGKLSSRVLQMKIENNKNCGADRINNRRRSFEDFSQGKDQKQRAELTQLPWQQANHSSVSIPFGPYRELPKRHRGLSQESNLGTAWDSSGLLTGQGSLTKNGRVDEGSEFKKNSTALHDAFSSISSATISSAKMAGIQATAEEWSTLQNIIGKIRSRNHAKSEPLNYISGPHAVD